MKLIICMIATIVSLVFTVISAAAGELNVEIFAAMQTIFCLIMTKWESDEYR